MARPEHRLTCVLPAFNEAESLPRTVAGWAEALPRHTRDHEIIVVDDGSTDDTARVLRELRARYARLRVISHDRNRGYSRAITNGFTQAAFPLLFFTDADGQYLPDDVHLLLERIAAADVVVGYRTARADPGVRTPLSRGYNFAVRHVIGVSLRDINCAFKLMRREAFRRLPTIDGAGFSFNAELMARARQADLRIVEIPVRHRPRLAGRSSVRPFHVVSSLYELARLRARQRRVPAHDRAPADVDAVATGQSSIGLEKTATP